MKYCKKIINIVSSILMLLFFCSTNSAAFAVTIAAEDELIEIQNLESFDDLILTADSMGDYSTTISAQIELLKNYSCVSVNEGTQTAGTVEISAWAINKKAIYGADYDNHKIGEYIFTARLKASDNYDICLSIPFPTIKIIILNSKTPIAKFEKIEDVLVKTDSLLGYSNLQDAEETLLNTYNSIKVNDGDDEVAIDSWTLSDSVEYNASKAGTYTFSAIIQPSDKYTVNENSPVLTVNIIISEPEIIKVSINEFESLPQIQLKTTSTGGYKTEADAKETLSNLYKNIKVNESNDTIPINGWSECENTTEYDSTKEGKYTFIASLGTSEKYDIENITIPLPTVEIIFSLSKGTISISLVNQDNTAIINANITVYNSAYSYYGQTDYAGNCIIENVIYGTYKVIAASNTMSFNKTVTVKDSFSSDYNWVFSFIKETTAITTPKITTAKVSTTKTAAAAENIDETPANNTQTENISVEDIESKIISTYNEPIKIKEMQADSGLQIEIAIDKVSDEQLTELKQMSTDNLGSEIQKAINAVSSINFIKTSDAARQEIADATGGLNASILPINFTQHASFSFPVKVSVSVGKGVYPVGSGYYLYYYNPDTGILESYGNASVDENGIVTFTISHCSDYFLMDKEISVNNIETLPNKITTQSQIETSTAKFIQVITNAPVTEPTAVTPSNISVQNPTKIIIDDESKKSAGQILIIFGLVIVLLCGTIYYTRHKIKK